MLTDISEVKTGSERVEEMLRARGIMPTAQRVLIGRELLLRPQHISAEQLLARVNMQGNVVSKATIYNTLGLFAEKGLIREVIIDPNKLFYDSNTSPHHHVYHLDDGMLEDISEEQVGVAQLPTLPEGLQVEGVDIIIKVRRARAQRISD